MFYDNEQGRNAFVEYRNKNLKKSKNWDFSYGFSPWFCSCFGLKLVTFPDFKFWVNRLEKYV